MAVIHVVIPCYNVDQFLEQAVYSVLNQPSKDIDIVLVDDGSPGNTPSICDNLAQIFSCVHVLHQENAGVSAARNTGINRILDKYSDNLAEHYIAFLDADDYWEDGFLDDSVLDLLKQKHDLIGFQSCTCNQSLQKTSAPTALDEGIIRGGANSVWKHSSSSFAAMIYSCEFLAKYNLRFQNGLKYSEDKIFSMQCMYLASSICLTNRLMYLYRITDGSAMGRRKFGISYYSPIILSYLEMDRQMGPWSNEERSVLLEGRRCASQYTMDMICEHYQQWGRKKVLDSYLSNHPELIDIVSGTGQYEMLTPNTEYQRYLQQPHVYIAKMYITGAILQIVRQLRRIIRKLI